MEVVNVRTVTRSGWKGRLGHWYESLVVKDNPPSYMDHDAASRLMARATSSRFLFYRPRGTSVLPIASVEAPAVRGASGIAWSVRGLRNLEPSWCDPARRSCSPRLSRPFPKA